MQLLRSRIFYNLVKNAVKTQGISAQPAGVAATTVAVKPHEVGRQQHYSKSTPKQKLLRFPALPLEETLEKFMKTTEPLLSESELAATCEAAKNFCRQEGSQLQKLLESVAQAEENWLAPRWLRAAYLQYRDPVTVYSSPGMTFPLQQFKDKQDYLVYAGKVIYGLIKYKELIDCGKIPVVKMGKFELDNSQFFKVFGTCRIPIYRQDKLEYNPNSKHVVVVYNNHFYKLPVYSHEGQPLHPEVLALELKIIMEKEPRKGIPFGILGTNERDAWSEAYDHLQRPLENRASLNEIETALFTVSLDECVPAEKGQEYNVMCEQLIHGGGSKYNSGNRWMDKTIQVVVNPNGMSGFTYEHSPAEGQPIALMSDYVMKHLNDDKHYQSAARDNYECPEKLPLMGSPSLDKHLEAAKSNVDRLAENLDMHVLHYDSYGKEFLKQQKFSPDSFVQITLQYAFYKLHKVPAAQYESAHLRIYANGRTETIRSCSNESVAFARAMCEGKCSDEERVKLLRVAIESHRAYTNLALQGRGVDRHLLGLKLMAIENKLPIPAFYSSPGFVKSSYFRMSTSQVATPNKAYMCYGPLTPDGYSCCYNPRECDIILALGSWRDCKETNSERFGVALREAFDSLQQLLLRAGEKPTSKL